jgi:hypothetical protein
MLSSAGTVKRLGKEVQTLISVISNEVSFLFGAPIGYGEGRPAAKPRKVCLSTLLPQP